MSWPYMDDTCYKAYKMMKEINPNCLMIYIGESIGGCTACDEFFLNTISSFDDIKFGNEESPNFSSDIIDITRELNNKFTSFNGNIVYMITNTHTYQVKCSNNNTILKESEWFKQNRTWPKVA